MRPNFSMQSTAFGRGHLGWEYPTADQRELVRSRRCRRFPPFSTVDLWNLRHYQTEN